MRTKLFGPLLSLCLAATSLPLAGCESVFASWLRYGDPSGGDGGILPPPEDLTGVDPVGADLTMVPDMTLPSCMTWEGSQSMGLPWLSSTLAIQAGAGVLWEKVGAGDFDGDGLFDIALAGTKTVAMVTTTIISVAFQNTNCSFSTPIELVNRGNIFDTFTDLRVFPAIGPKWDIALLGNGGQLIWCRHETGMTFQCSDAAVPTSMNNNNLDRKIIVDDRGRTRMSGDFIVVQQKGGTDSLLTIQRNGANGYMALIPAFQIASEDPNYAAPMKFGTDKTAVAIGVTRSGTQDLLRVHRPDGTTTSTTTSLYVPNMVTGSMDAENVYLYTGAFTSDDYDDVVAIGKPSTARPVLIFPFVMAGQPATMAGSAFPNYARDMLMARDLNDDLVDELVAVTPGTSSFNTYRRDATGFGALVTKQQMLGAAVKAFTIASMRPSHKRPDLLYLSTATPTQLVIHRPNPGFVPVP